MPHTPQQFLIPRSEYDPGALLEPWRWLITSPGTLIAVSLFGDLFLLESKGGISCLDVVNGEVTPVASCIEEFEYDLGTEAFQKERLLADLAEASQAKGVQRGFGECFAFTTPPMLGGQLLAENIQSWNLLSYEKGLSKLFLQVRDLPQGTHVIPKFADSGA